MGHVTEHSRSEFIKKDHLIDADKKNHFDAVSRSESNFLKNLKIGETLSKTVNKTLHKIFLV